MKSYFFESSDISSISALSQLQKFVAKQHEPIELVFNSLFDADKRFIELCKNLKHDSIELQLDEIRFEHVQFIYSIFESDKIKEILLYVQQSFNLLDDRLKMARVLGYISDLELENSIILLQNISLRIVEYWLNFNDSIDIPARHSKGILFSPLFAFDSDLDFLANRLVGNRNFN